MKIEAWINDEAEEYLMNLAAQGYYAEAYELIMKLRESFTNGLYIIAGRTLEAEAEKQIKIKIGGRLKNGK